MGQQSHLDLVIDHFFGLWHSPVLKYVVAIFGDVCTCGISYSIISWPVAIPGDRPSGEQKAISAKNYLNHRAPTPLSITIKNLGICTCHLSKTYGVLLVGQMTKRVVSKVERWYLPGEVCVVLQASSRGSFIKHKNAATIFNTDYWRNITTFQYLALSLTANWVTLISHLLAPESDSENENVKRAESSISWSFSST